MFSVSPFDLIVPVTLAKNSLRAHFQCVVLAYDLNSVENANQRVSTQAKFMNIHMRCDALVSLSIKMLFKKILY